MVLHEPRQADRLQRAGLACLARFDARRVALLHIMMHFREHLPHAFAQSCREQYLFPPMRRRIEHCALWHFRAIHLFQTHGLRTELESVGIQ